MTLTDKLPQNRDILTLDTLRSERRDEILRLANQRGAHDVRVFGSVARGEANENSDLDLLVASRGQGAAYPPSAVIPGVIVGEEGDHG